MTHFEKEFFKKFEFEPGEIERHFQSALRDLEIAEKDPFAEVRFSYAFQALIKGGIALIAKAGKVKVRSVPGHHFKILTKMSEVVGDEDILAVGNAMRAKRNANLYEAGKPIGKKEADDYFHFVKTVLNQIKKRISEQ